MKPFRLLTTLLALASVATAACAPYVGTCTWVEVEGAEALAARETHHNECSSTTCEAPGVFEIRRASYVLRFWNGDRWYAQLLVRARGGRGEILPLDGTALQSLQQAEGLTGRWTEFEYMVQLEELETADGPMTLAFDVKSATGETLGRERVVLREGSCEYLAVEGL